MDPRVNELIARHYPVVVGIERDVDGTEHFAAWLLDMPGCAAQGESREGALDRLEAIKAAYLTKLVDLGVAPPEPTDFPAVIPGPTWFDDQTGRPRQVAAGELADTEAYGSGLQFRVVPA